MQEPCSLQSVKQDWLHLQLSAHSRAEKTEQRKERKIHQPYDMHSGNGILIAA